MSDEWRIEYDNDTGPMDEGFWEWWTVTNGKTSFKCDDPEGADWLLSVIKNTNTNPL